MITDFQKTQEALMLVALARFALDIADSLHHPVTWEVESRKVLQDQARRLLGRVKAITHGP